MTATLRQNGKPLTITRTKLDRQIRKVRARDARNIQKRAIAAAVAAAAALAAGKVKPELKKAA